MRVSTRCEHGAIILFDFSAAFHSISHEFLHEMLGESGTPASIRNFIQCLYHDNTCHIKLKGCCYEGFAMTRGVRQGCPLSPLLFVLAVDILLRRLERLFGTESNGDSPSAMTRAYADDTAMVVEDFFEMGPAILQTFDEFETFSGLQLNMRKTLVVPLWEHTAESVTAALALPSLIRWQRANVHRVGVYLGFEVGPGRTDAMWQKHCQKYRSRVGMWESVALGLQFTARAYNTFAVTVLSYLWQLA